MFNSVLFPAPFSPTRPMTSPWLMSRETSESAWTCRNDFETFSTRRLDSPLTGFSADAILSLIPLFASTVRISVLDIRARYPHLLLQWIVLEPVLVELGDLLLC